MSKELAEILFPEITLTPQDLEKKYPRRNLPEGARVTRFAPSPTGFLHIGGLFAAMISKVWAEKSGGVFYLRIEDTDKKREIENGVKIIIDGLSDFGITFSEGMTGNDTEVGDYGPYLQSKREEIYKTYAKDLVAKGLAYPCFMTEEELEEIRIKQEELKLTPGIYGEFAKCRDLSIDAVKERLNKNLPYVIRLKSGGNIENRIVLDDLIKGEISMPENNLDIVLLKSDGIPTYHFAHAVDDHLMGTTDVIRGDEWISSYPIHYELFKVLGFTMPRYAHISPIMKQDNGGKRKLSKRKDPEAAVSYYHEMGYPKEAVIEYLMTLANSNFEDWRAQNPTADINEFPFELSKMSPSGALFDLVKLTDISKNYISKLNCETLYNMLTSWAKEYDKEFLSLLEKDPQYAKRILNIEREIEKPRKDIAKLSDVKDYISYFYDEIWDGKLDFPENINKEDIINILNTYKDIFNENDDKETWFERIRQMCPPLGFAAMPKEYKKNPGLYKGHVGDVSTVIRVAATGRRNTPDLYEILMILGKEKVTKRLLDAINKL
ncbi:MAG: glutamate--tRNA ligase [Clostridiaceae bacterium]|nr:glutamate--tRNA ligase [Clostridiaceae bacterium]